MSLLKVNEVQNYNGSSLTLTASTVSTSAQLNTGGNISVTGSINVSDDSTTRSNLGLGSIATQASNNVTITGGNISNATLASSVGFPAGHIVDYKTVLENTTIVAHNTSGGGNYALATSTITSISVKDGQSVILRGSGGIAYGNASTAVYGSTPVIFYTIDGTNPSLSGTSLASGTSAIYGGYSFDIDGGTTITPGIVTGKYSNTSGSDITLKFNWGVYGNSYNAIWQSGSTSPIFLEAYVLQD